MKRDCAQLNSILNVSISLLKKIMHVCITQMNKLKVKINFQSRYNETVEHKEQLPYVQS